MLSEITRSQIQCLPNNEVQYYNEASVEQNFKVLEILLDREEITKGTCNVLKNLSKKFLWAVGRFPYKFNNDDIVNYRLLPSLSDAKKLNRPLDIMDYMWGMRVTNIRVYYNIGDNRFKKEVDNIKALWSLNCLPNLNTLTIEVADTPSIKKGQETQYPEVAGLFSVFEKVIFSYCYAPWQTAACHDLAIKLFLPSLTQVKSVVLSIHPGNYPYFIEEKEREELRGSYMERSANFVEHCQKLNLSVDFDLKGKLGKPWSNDYLM